MTRTATPPCNQVCWEWVTHVTWRYTLPVNHCGHHQDPQTRLWHWPHRPTENPA
jgi:hypothetical protein